MPASSSTGGIGLALGGEHLVHGEAENAATRATRTRTVLLTRVMVGQALEGSEKQSADSGPPAAPEQQEQVDDRVLKVFIAVRGRLSQ